MSVLCLLHHRVLEGDSLSGFTEEFCLRTRHSLSLTLIHCRWYFDEIVSLELALEWVKTLGLLGWGECILHFMDPKGSSLWAALCPPKFPC